MEVRRAAAGEVTTPGCFPQCQPKSAMVVAFQKTILSPCISSVKKAKKFYIRFLGFAVDWALPICNEPSAQCLR
jgi:hypothetical protein